MNSNKTPSSPESKTHLIIVMGVSGSGKSTLAEALAKHYGYTYLDGDDFHSEASRNLMANGIPLTDEDRAPWVAALQQKLKDQAATHAHTILAFSGLKQKHRNELRKANLHTLFLFLNGNKDIVQTRINNREGHFMAPKLLDSQFDSLECPLSENDVYTVDINVNIEQVTSQAKAIIDQALLTSSCV